MSQPDEIARPAPAYGFSLALDDGDLVLVDGELVRVHDLANLLQALTLRVLTAYGSDRFDTRYGLDLRRAFTEPHGRRMARELLRLDLIRTLASDPRVAEIQDVIFLDDDTTGPRVGVVEVVLETITGATSTVIVDPGTGLR
jgi:hypothetical protein